MSLKIVTGKTAVPHVTSDDDAALNAGVFGQKSVVLATGERLEAEILSANSIKIKDGDFSLQGKIGRILPGTYETVSIANGTTEYNRSDIIAVEYQKDESGIESMELVVISGEPSKKTPQDPSITISDMRSGDTTVVFPIYRVNVVGLSIDSIDKLFTTAPLVTSSAPIGSGMDYFGVSEPFGWLFCNGQAVSKTDYPELFEIIGYTYSASQSGSTFNVPDLRERVTVGINALSDFDVLGKKLGESKHTLTVNEIPSHNHAIIKWAPGTDGYTNSEKLASAMYNGSSLDPENASITHSQRTGGGQAHNNIQPSFVCHKIIRAF